jgi:protein TonB
VTPENEPVTLEAEVPFYVARNEEISGPHRVGAIPEMLDAASLFPDDLIWLEGLERWQPLRSTFLLEVPETLPPPLEEPPEGSPLAAEEPAVPEPLPEPAIIPEPTPAKPALREDPGEDWESGPVRMPDDSSSGRLGIAITAGVLAHIVLFCILLLGGSWILKFRDFPPVAAASEPPPLEVALVPEEDPAPPAPPTPPEPQPEAAPPPDLTPPPPPAPPLIAMPTMPPAPIQDNLATPAPPPMADLPVPSEPRHAVSPPRKVVSRRVPTQATQTTQSAQTTETVSTVSDAGPTDYLYAPLPDYPPSALQMRQSGTVILRVSIDENGIPTDVSIDQSSGYSVLDHSARKKVRDSYRFKVGSARILRVPIPFVLNH